MIAALSAAERNSSFRAGTRQISSFISHRAFRESQLRSAGGALILPISTSSAPAALAALVKSVEAWNWARLMIQWIQASGLHIQHIFHVDHDLRQGLVLKVEV